MTEKDPHQARRRRDRGRRPLSVGRKLLLSAVITLTFFAALELALATFGVLPQSYRADPYVGFSSQSPLFVEETSTDGAVEMVTATNKHRLFNRQRFPKVKNRGVFRIFCVGGSTTYGRPYGDRTSFAGWLRELLPAADPSRQWEVINAGGISYASYRVALLLEELATFEPDLVIIYTGHNEFLERRTYADIIDLPPAVRGLGALLSRTRTGTVMRAAIDRLRSPAPVSQPATTLLDDDVITLLDGSVGPSAYTRDDQARDRILSHFRFNLDRMIDIVRSSGARPLLITPASNLRHFAPFKSEHRADLGQNELERCDRLLDEARRQLDAGAADQALATLDQALVIDDRYADTLYLRGRALDRLGRMEEAKQAYIGARDEDVCPLRALSAAPSMVAEAAQRRGVTVVDFATATERRAEHGIPGRDLFFDHVHPTIEANRSLALALIDALVENGVVAPASSWNEDAVAEVVTRAEAQLVPGVHAEALKNLSKVLGWAGKVEEARRLALEAVALDPDDASVQYQAGLCAQLVGDVDAAISHYLASVRADPDTALSRGNLGAALEDKGLLGDALVHYRKALELAPASRRHRANLLRTLVKAGYVAYSRGRFDESIEVLEEASQIEPKNADVHDRLGVALTAARRYQPAAEAFRRAVELAPERAEVHNRLALTLVLAGHVEEGLRAWSTALDLSPELADSPQGLVQMLLRMGLPDQAERARRVVAGR